MPEGTPVTPKKFLTNQGENTLRKRLEKILPLTQDFDCLVGYFFISGFFRLYPSLESVKKIRILIGLKNEQVIHGLVQIAKDSPEEASPSTAEIKQTFGGMLRKELVEAQDMLAIEVGIANYDPNTKEPSDDYRILVTTDVLAEGVNLHRSATVINYDIPWNPSRLMQRVGRVNRVGTKFKTIFTYNFFPTDEGNDEIALTEAAKSKIHAFITLLGNDARLLTGDEKITSHNLFDRINSKKAAEGDEAESKSELKYLRQILNIKEKEPKLFQRILSLPRKARSTRSHVPVTAPVEAYDMSLPADRPAVISYFRQGRLDKFFHAHNGNALAEELDFFTTAEILETTAKEARGDIPAELFYPLLDKNKSGFHTATTPSVETLLPSTAAGGGNEAILLKRLRVTSFRNCDAFKPEDRKFVSAVHQIIADGRVGKATIRKVKEAFDETADPLEMLAILRKEIAGQYLLGG